MFNLKKNKDDTLYNIVYSHSDYSDIWPLYFGQTKKYFNNEFPKIIFSNQNSNKISKDYKLITYKDAQTYPERLIECFGKLNAKYCIFSHEDMFLYDYPKNDILDKYIKAMQENRFDFIRLIKGGDCVYKESDIDKTLFELDGKKSKWIFSIQPIIWKIDSLVKILKKHKKDNIWELEEKAQKTCKKLKIKGAFSFGEGKKRGIHHFDNNVYPYIATAIVKGKWNISEYSDILPKLLEEYNIDYKIRGKF